MDPQQLAQMAAMEAQFAQMQGGKPAKQAHGYTDAEWGIPGFGEALSEAVMPLTGAVAIYDPGQLHEIEDIKNKVGTKILKAAKKFTDDERCEDTGTGLQARSLIEEFVDWAAGQVSQAFYDKPWLEKVNLAAPLLAAALHTFNGAKIFTRTLAPMLPKYIEEALFRYAEEERVTKAMFDAVVASGVKDNMQKKASQHLAKAYDTAHIKAPYGSTTADSAELGMLQDFVKGWMVEFVTLALWDILEKGIATSHGRANRGDQVLFLTVLFQNLTDARNAALPHELTSLIETPPPSPWAFIAETAETVFNEVEQNNKVKAEEMAKWKAEQAMKDMGMMGGGKGGMGDMMGMMAMMEGMMGGGGMEQMMGMMEGMMGGKGGKGMMDGMMGGMDGKGGDKGGWGKGGKDGGKDGGKKGGGKGGPW